MYQPFQPRNGGGAEVALVSNIEPPEEFRKLLFDNGVKIINAPFDSFTFKPTYPWALAFYKLCALKYVVENFDYDNYCFLDSDVYVQGNLSDLWKECQYKIMALHLGWTITHDRYWQKQIDDFGYANPGNRYIIHYGGEFFAASREHCRLFIATCEEIHQSMLAKDYETNHGDEFITSIALDRLSHLVKNARAYVFRFSTRVFRITTEHYRTHPLAILHVPGEKSRGMSKIYNRYIRKGKIPSRSTVHKLLHLSRPSIEVRLKRLFYNMMVRLGRYNDNWGEFPKQQ